jgi:rhodanese-related sulfurtransferase
MDQLEVTAEAVKEQLKRGEALFFLEVRRGGDRDTALMKVRGALRLVDDDVENHLDEIPRERTVLVYSVAPEDQPALAAARLLRERGFPQVQVISGGFNACRFAGIQVVEIGDGKNMTRLRGF